MPVRYIETEHGERCLQHVWMSEDGYYVPEEDARAWTGDPPKPWIRRLICRRIPVGEEIPLTEEFKSRRFERRQIMAPSRIQPPHPFTCNGRTFYHYSSAEDDPSHEKWRRDHDA